MNTIRCIGIIPDGNRRWARENRVPVTEGYIAGTKKVKEMVEWAGEHHIPNIVIYGLSAENLQREPDMLDSIFSTALSHDLPNGGDSVSFKVVGEMNHLPREIVEKLRETEKSTEHNKDVTLWALIAYGGQQDIVKAVNTLVRKGEQIVEKDFKNVLSTKNVPYPELIIRTGNMKRLSNFLPWESSYSEIFFLKPLWPDLTKKEFDAVIQEYMNTPINRGK